MRSGSVPAGDAGNPPDASAEPARGFVGLSLEEAVRRAEEQSRPWRIARQDDEVFVLTDDLVEGRVTFELDGGTVTVASLDATGGSPAASEDEQRAELVAAAVTRLVMSDNSFGGGDVFDRVEVAEVIGGDPTRQLQSLTRELIALAIDPTARVVFIPDADAAIDRLFDGMTQPVGVVSVEDARFHGDRAELDMRLWCGSLCGVFLTYEAELTEKSWQIRGTTGPIAIS